MFTSSPRAGLRRLLLIAAIAGAWAAYFVMLGPGILEDEDIRPRALIGPDVHFRKACLYATALGVRTIEVGTLSRDVDAVSRARCPDHLR